MIILDPTQEVPTHLRGAVVAIGNFDGLHRGHQTLLNTARAQASALNVPLITLTFDPHPRRYFRPDSTPFLITPGALKYDRLRAANLDAVLTLPFDDYLALMEHAVFTDIYLKQMLNAAHVVVGHDFHFGHNRGGNAATIQAAGIPVTAMDLMVDETGSPYSSTRIRAALQEGHIADANALLGWDFEIRATVIHGDKRGRDIGFPTLNLDLGDAICPAHGIYACWVQIVGDETWHMGAASLGLRPMFALEKPLLEVHLLDFNRDIYGHAVRVKLVQKLRGEAKFDGLDALAAQIKEDCRAVAKLLQQLS